MIIGTVKVGKKFSVEYANNLYAMIKRSVSIPFTFVCITDDTTGLHKGIVPVEAKKGLWGWWHYMEFYSHDIGNSNWHAQHRVYFGLDTVIRGDITSAVQRTKYTLSLDFNYLLGNPNALYANTWADCAAVIPKGGMDWLYERFWEQHKKDAIGLSHYPMHVWVTHQLMEHLVTPDIWQGIAPGVMCSYKWPSPKIDEPEEPMVFFHGPPMIHQVLDTAPWLKKYWHSEDLS